jgi:hypothetical protein
MREARDRAACGDALRASQVAAECAIAGLDPAAHKTLQDITLRQGAELLQAKLWIVRAIEVTSLGLLSMLGMSCPIPRVNLRLSGNLQVGWHIRGTIHRSAARRGFAEPDRGGISESSGASEEAADPRSHTPVEVSLPRRGLPRHCTESDGRPHRPSLLFRVAGPESRSAGLLKGPRL